MPTGVAQKEKPAQATGTWNSVFPNEQTNPTQSLLYVKKLVAVTVSSISYLRAIFPDHAFGDRCLDDLSLKILRDDSSCKGASQVIKWVKGCFDALEKKYLKTLILGIYTDASDPDTVIESYTFKFSYDNQGGIDIYRNEEKVSGAYSADQTKKATIQLLRTLILLSQTLGTLPDEVMMTMKLLYYDDVTPADYEPPGFRAADNDTFKFDDDTTNIRVGEVATNFHSIKLRMKTAKSEYRELNEGGESASQPTDTADDNNTGTARIKQEITDDVVTSYHDDIVMKNPESRKVDKNKSGKATKPGPSGDCNLGPVEEIVRCPCECNEDDGLMINCELCHVWQHGLCFKVTDESNAPLKHFCETCSVQVPRTVCTDPLISGLDPEACKFVCLWRRTLEACAEGDFQIGVSTLSKRLGCPMGTAHFLVNRMEQEGIISGASSSKSKKRGRQIDKNILNENLTRFLYGDDIFNVNNADVSVRTEATQQSDLAAGSQIDKLTELADGMSVSAIPQQQYPPAKHARNKKEKTQKRTKRGAQEFDLVNSQSDDFHHGTAKRRKASDVHMNINI